MNRHTWIDWSEQPGAPDSIPPIFGRRKMEVSYIEIERGIAIPKQVDSVEKIWKSNDSML